MDEKMRVYVDVNELDGVSGGTKDRCYDYYYHEDVRYDNTNNKEVYGYVVDAEDRETGVIAESSFVDEKDWIKFKKANKGTYISGSLFRKV